MTFREILPLFLVFLAIPSVGVALYGWLCIRMRKRGIADPPYITYFFLFAHGGIWFLLVLTTFLWGWSGMSSLGVFYLILVSPFPAAVLGFLRYPARHDSAFHRWAFRLCFSYASAIVALLATWIIYGNVARS